MKLQDKHIEFIENSLKFYGIDSPELREDLLDHICTYIETQDSEDFDTLYQQALQKFGGYSSFQNLQLEANLQKLSRDVKVLSKLQFGVGTFVSILFILGFIFKVMHWPYANVLMIIGILIASLVLIPVYLYTRYKKSVHKFS